MSNKLIKYHTEGSAALAAGLSVPEPSPDLNLITSNLVPNENNSSEKTKDAWRDQVAYALWADGEHRASERFIGCGSIQKFYCGNCGHSKKAAWFCMMRICPECAQRESINRVRLIVTQVMQKQYVPSWSLKLLTLTVKTDGELEESVLAIKKGLDLFWKRILWRDKAGKKWSDVKGKKKNNESYAGLYGGLEFGPKNLNVHGHFLYYGPYLDQRLLDRIWKECLASACKKLSKKRDGRVWINRVDNQEKRGGLIAAAKEVGKYISDIKKIEGDKVVMMHRALKGHRRIISKGCFRGLKDEEMEKKLECPDCGHEHWVSQSGLDWMLKNAEIITAIDPPIPKREEKKCEQVSLFGE